MPQVTPSLNPQQVVSTAWFSWTDAGGNSHNFFFDIIESEDWSEGAKVTEHPVEVGYNITDNVRVQLRSCTLKAFVTNEPITANQWTDMGESTQPLDWSVTAITNIPQVLIVPTWNSNLAERVLIGTAGGFLGSVLGGSIGGGIGSELAAEIAAASLPGVVVPVPVPVNAGLVMNRGGGIGQAIAQLQAPSSPNDFVASTIQLLEGLKNGCTLCTVYGTKAEPVTSMVIEGLDHHRSSDTGTGAEITIRFKEIRIVASQLVVAPAPTVPRAQPPTSNGNQNTTPVYTPKASIAYSATH